jgi:hypothetical protein
MTNTVNIEAASASEQGNPAEGRGSGSSRRAAAIEAAYILEALRK